MQNTAIVAGTIPNSADLGNIVRLNRKLGLVFKLDRERDGGEFQWMVVTGKWSG